jgi:hypothetical protein
MCFLRFLMVVVVFIEYTLAISGEIKTVDTPHLGW